MISVLLVDDDHLVTEGIKTIIELTTRSSNQPMSVCGIGHNGLQAIELYQTHKPDIVLMDIRMPEMDGIQAGKKILAQFPDAQLIYLTTFLEDDYIVEALQIGAKGYLLKTDFKSLIPAIHAVGQGQRVFGDEIIEKIPKMMPSAAVNFQPQNHPQLNDKEQLIVYHIAQGLNSKEIAEAMHFSEGTIRNYLSVILEKLQLRDRTQLAIYYYKHLKEN